MLNKLKIEEKKLSLDEQLLQVRKLWKDYDTAKRIVEISKEGPGHFSIQLKSVNHKIDKVQYSFVNIVRKIFKRKG